MTKTNNQRIRDAYQSYRMSNMENLYDAYGRPSDAKLQAWTYCRKLCYEHGGRALKVIGAGTFTFSAGFLFTDENGKACFCWITKDYDRYMEV